MEPSLGTCRGFPHSAVSTIDPLASQAALTVLRRGGSAVDAAIAANAVLSVVAMDTCGLGGDLVGLVYQPRTPRSGPKVHALMGVGRAGSHADAESLRAAGFRLIPRDHPAAITVPGAVDAWLLAHERFGRLPLETVLTDAIAYANDGFPAPARLARGAEELWRLGYRSELVLAFQENFQPGTVVRHRGIGRTLAALVRLGREGFYAGEFGAELVALSQGALRADDLATPQAELASPVGVEAMNLGFLTAPPPSAGFLALALLRALPWRRPHSALEAYLDLVDAVEATRWLRAYHYDGVDVADLLGSPRRPVAGRPRPRAEAPDTTAIVVVDRNHGACVFVQSNAHSFGTRLATPDTGIFVHSRGAVGFDLDPRSPNELKPRRRPRHTLAPVMALDRATGQLRIAAGTMGGDRQPTILAQVIAAALRNGLEVREALARARLAEVRVIPGEHPGFDTHVGGAATTWAIERHADEAVRQELNERLGGIIVEPPLDPAAGVAHLAMLDSDAIVACSDPRAEDGSAIGW